MPWVCSTGTAVLDPDSGGRVCVDEDGQILDGVNPRYEETPFPGESDGNKQIRPTPMVQLGGSRELGVTDTFDRSDQTVKTSVEYAEGLPNRIRAEGGGTESQEYKDLEKGLKGYFNQSFSSYTSVDSAWNRVVEDAKAGNQAAMDLLAGGKQTFDILGDPSKRGTRGSGAPSVTYSIDNANEEDIYTLAQGLAMEMIGRPISEKQFDKLLQRVRKEEQASPTVTRRSGNTVTTEAGITTEERQSVMAELLQENPQWQQHQMTQGVLDALTRNIQEAKRLDSGV